MIHMNPVQSWITMMLILAFAGCFVVLLRQIDQKIYGTPSTDNSVAESADTPDEHLAPVIELGPIRLERERVRHLAIAADSCCESSDDFYDWQVHGL